MSIRSIADYLAEHPFFAGLDAASVQQLAGCARNEHLKAGEYLFRQGGTAEHFYVIMDGRITLELSTANSGPTSWNRPAGRGTGLAMADSAAPVALRRPGGGAHQCGVAGIGLPARGNTTPTRGWATSSRSAWRRSCRTA